METQHRFGSLFIAAKEDASKKLLEKVGLRPTRQRVSICALLFTGEARHVAVESLHSEAKAHGFVMSVSTVYNVLRQFEEAGLVRRIAVPGAMGVYDVNVGDHQHFFIPDEHRIIDMPPDSVSLEDLPEPPEGYCIDKVDVVVHLKRLPAKDG